MFELAVKAGLPLIGVTTKDVLNYMEVITHSIGHLGTVFKVNGIKDLDADADFLVWYSPKMLAFEGVYSQLMDRGRVIILVNPREANPLLFDAGELPTPKELIAKELTTAGFGDRKIQSLLPALSGLNLIEVGEVCRLAMAKYGELTAQSASNLKMLVSNPTGVLGIDTKQDFYMPDDRLQHFADSEYEFLITGDDDRLRPRGLLLHGGPGIGKSQGARYLARKWKLPLYMLDLSSIMGKYVGQSESAMRNTFLRIDAEEPCVLLIDEVEKAYADSGGDSGVTSRLLGQLLWWLAEHTSKVVTVLTSNNISKLPKELYRPGRIDHVWEFLGLTAEEVVPFATSYAHKFSVDLEFSLSDFSWGGSNTRISHAVVVGRVKQLVKEHIIKTGGVA